MSELEGTNSAPAESAPMNQEQGQQAIADLLSGKSRRTNPEVEKHSEPERLSAEADDAPAQAPDDGADTDSDEPDTDDAPEPIKYRLADGTEVTPDEIEEWRRGTLRQSDYTRKTQEIAEQRKQFEERQAEIAQKAQTFDQNINFAIQVAEQYLPKPPTSEMLDSDPIGYLQQREAYETKANELRQLYQARQQHQEAQTKERMQSFEQMKAKEAELLIAAMPQLKDKAKLETFQKDILEVLPHYGFSQDDLQQVYDHRLVRMLADATAYRKLMKSKPLAEAKGKDAAPVQQPGKRHSPAEEEARSRQSKMRDLRKTGDKRIAVDLIKNLL